MNFVRSADFVTQAVQAGSECEQICARGVRCDLFSPRVAEAQILGLTTYIGRARLSVRALAQPAMHNTWTVASAS